MQAFTVESKTALAKLMATENVTIEHRKMSTARFDPINRVLYLPIWKNMSGYMYDLLGGHEVGHARWTPADGWHNAVIDPTKKRSYKSFLNVVEDARIEKKIQRKYPGLRNSFRLAYAELMEQDFFGIKGMNVNFLPFIDRLNIHTKSQYTANIRFNEIESGFLERILVLESWEEVITLTDEIYAYSKGEQNQIKQNNDFEKFDFSDSSGEDGEEYDLEQSDQDDIDDEAGESEDGGAEDDSEDSDGDSVKGKKDSDEENEDESEKDSIITRNKESSPAEEDQFDPECKTDDTYRSNEGSLLDEQCKEYLYLTIPKPTYKNIITPASRVQKLLSESFDAYPTRTIEFRKYVTDFKSKNERYVSLLAKEFEMRKAAKKYSKAKISNTGDLDINKLSSYKFDDNIFRKMTIVPKGKSHGMILLLDRSGSMSTNMAGSIEQILVLSMFCRKVNIPFTVYGFGDQNQTRMLDFPNANVKEESCFDEKDKTIAMGTVYLREYINSSMSNTTFSNAFRNMVLLLKGYENNPMHPKIFLPQSERLSSTPLLQAMVAMKDIMVEFKRKNNLDLTNLVIVHDGDADSCLYYNEKCGDNIPICTKINSLFNNVIVDNTVKFQYQLPASKNSDDLHAGMTKAIFQWFQKSTESKIFGFFLAPTNYRGQTMKALENQFYDEEGKKIIMHGKEYFASKEKLNIVMKQLKKEKFVISKKPGFNAFFIVVGGTELAIGNEEMDIQGKVTSAKLKNAFSNLNKRKLINRVLVSKFIQGIAA